jgi:hypothetical protein
MSALSLSLLRGNVGNAKNPSISATLCTAAQPPSGDAR